MDGSYPFEEQSFTKVGSQKKDDVTKHNKLARANIDKLRVSNTVYLVGIEAYLLRYEDMSDQRSKTEAVVKLKPEKNSGLFSFFRLNFHNCFSCL